ncbi:map kinase kinase [Grosmannia clavigera kw1407]|uniref:mitogen-activated protein kinase kinase n=1 Tax=Grosmannia clavigera (strain kw1407 / UAMH 11150) TaxID=655863 RepID=F0XJ95_GROCL|nr:map kinase kinase [Grosmannia clavigera kw1407]EFX02360.1 map kinase kinase [Grosmannia clavigera kw1407]
MDHDQGSGPGTPDEECDSGPASGGSIDSRDDTAGRDRPNWGFDPAASSQHAADLSPSLSQPMSSQQPADLPQSPRRLPSLRTVSDPQTSTVGYMSSTSTVSGTLNNARRPPPSAGNLPQDLMQKARALQQKRMAMSPHSPGGASGPLSDASHASLGGALAGGIASNMRLPAHLNRNMGLGGIVRPGPPGFHQSAPSVPSASGRRGGPSLSERRAMKLGPLPGGPGGASSQGPPKLSDMDGGGSGPGRAGLNGGRNSSRISDFKHYIDAEKGWITFEGAATITRTGVNFAGGHTFKISLDEIQVLEELGKGNYGTVYKARHAKPAKPRFGPGLSGFKQPHIPPSSVSSISPPTASPQQSLAGSANSPAIGEGSASADSASRGPAADATTGKVMAMKEIRLELDEAKFTTILKELVILHECVSPYIIDFYGAFYQEGAVYMCIEYMDGGSIDKLYAGGIPEPVLRKITYSTVIGLKSLKDEHNIIHRDVKPTNILVNTRGQVKICDFGVSGNLVSSIAKTNIGCQSYMAPERISGGSLASGGANAQGTYSVQSDIWSLGLTIIECAMGRYPYPPEVSSTIFSQLSAIVNGEPPVMPDNYSSTAHDFVRSCLNKNPLKRHTYSMLLKHPWLKSLAKDETIEEVENEDSTSTGSDSDDVVQKMESVDLSTEGSEDVSDPPPVAGDEEVAAWAVEVLEKKKSGSLGTAGETAKPALHTAPLAP